MAEASENGPDASYSSYPAETHPRFMATLTLNPQTLRIISAQTMWMDSISSEHHNSLPADNLPAVTPAAAFMKCCGCSGRRSMMSVFQGPLPHHLQCHFRLIFREAAIVLSPSRVRVCSCRAGVQRRVFAGCQKHAKPRPRLREVLTQSSRHGTAGGLQPTPLKPSPTELSHNMDISSKIIIRSANLSRTNTRIWGCIC